MAEEKKPAQAEMSLHAGHRQRVRDKVLAGSLDNMADHELIELLLFYAIPKRDVNPLAHRLLNTFGTIDRVLEAPAEELMKVDGVGPGVARLFGACSTAIRHYIDAPCRGAGLENSVESYVEAASAHFVHPTRQEMAVLCLDSSGSLLTCAVRDWDIVADPEGAHWLAGQIIASRAHQIVLVWRRYAKARYLTGAETDAFNSIINILSCLEIRLNDFILLHEDKAISLRQARKLVDIAPKNLSLADGERHDDFLVDSFTVEGEEA